MRQLRQVRLVRRDVSYVTLVVFSLPFALGERQAENYQMHLPSPAFQADSPIGRVTSPSLREGRAKRGEGLRTHWFCF